MAARRPHAGAAAIRRAWTWVALLWSLSLGPGCGSKEPLDQLISELDDFARREQAIDAILQLIRRAPPNAQPEIKRRAIDALMEAYREDQNRDALVNALAALADRRAGPVLVAALADAERGGSYLEAAIVSARALGELGAREDVPALVTALTKSGASSKADRVPWLQRAIIEALDRLHDSRSVPALISVLQTDPTQQDYYLNRLAATALGRLGDPRSIKPLVTSLSTSSHGLLLFEESRRALCRLGPPAIPELLAAAQRRDKRGQPDANAKAAAHVVADLGDRTAVQRLAESVRPKDPVDYRLALAEAQLRLGIEEAQQAVLELVADSGAALTSRRRAAEILGWYGRGQVAAQALRAVCAKDEAAAGNVVCWSAALAFTRLAGPEGVEQLASLLQSRKDAATRHYLESYRSRLALVWNCREDRPCYVRELRNNEDWRVRERAALELGRLALAGTETDGAELARELARNRRGAHPQVQEAVLVSLERLGVTPEASVSIGRSLEAARSDDTPPAILSRTLCLGQRLIRASEVKR